MDRNDPIDPNGSLPPAAPSEPESPCPAPEENPSLGEWLARNGPTLVLAALVFFALYYWLEGAGLWSLTKAALGLGLVIFIHELGHFAVAKWCDVHVETFSIGFGPALPGCKFQYGETTYMIALFPLGGYVKMVGEGAESEDGDEDPRSFKNKSVWQRMAIISAGVTMNVILAFLCFIIVFRGPGKKMKSGVIGYVGAGSPAWQNDIPAGADILQIGSKKDHIYFETILPEVMLSGGRPQELVYSFLPYLKKREDVKIEPRMEGGRRVIGILAAESLQLATAQAVKGTKFKHPVYPGSPADKAEPPFEFGDTIIGCTDPDDPEKDWTPLPDDPRHPDKPQKDFFAFANRLVQLAGKPVTIRVERKEKESTRQISIRVPPAFHRDLGLHMQMGQITAIRPPCPEGKNQPFVATSTRDGDVIEQVELGPQDRISRFLFPSSKPVFPAAKGRELDPLRLRVKLQKYAAENPKWDRVVTLKVRRQNPQANSQEMIPKELKLRWENTDKENADPDKIKPLWKFARELPLGPHDPTSIPELGICFRVQTTVAGVDKLYHPDMPMMGNLVSLLFGEQSLKPGDIISEIRFWKRDLKDKGKEKPDDFTELEPDQWAFVFEALQRPGRVPRVDLLVKSGKEAKVVSLLAREDSQWPLSDLGLLLMSDQRIQRADSTGEAIVMGLEDTWTKIKQIYETLRSIFTGDVSVKNLGGPITIGRVAYSIAGENFWEFVYFLGLISINLAVVNFLPIPILDGGHMVFLIYEKIRGKPASEQVRAAATYVGLLALASIMIFVLYLDISRIVNK